VRQTPPAAGPEPTTQEPPTPYRQKGGTTQAGHRRFRCRSADLTAARVRRDLEAQEIAALGIYRDMAPVLAQRQRPDRAFERLYRRHVGDVYRYAFAVLRNQADAEDVTQTTFLNAYRAFQRGERPDKPHNWLIAIAHNVCRQRFRQSARRPVEVSFDDDVAASLVETDESPTGEDIRRALGHLAFSQRAALVMRELEGRSYAEIADILELTTGAVETLIFRARRALREQLESTLTCAEAELAISKQLDGRLSRAQKGALRAHLRECRECATFARRQRAQRTALRSLAAIPVPPWLGSLFGGGGASVGSGLAVKAAVAVAAGAAIGGAGYVGVHDAVTHRHHGAAHASSSTQRTAGPIQHAPAIAHQAVVATPRIAHSTRKQPKAAAHKRHKRSKQHKQHKQHARAPHRQLGAVAARAQTKHRAVVHVRPARGHVAPATRSHRPVAPPGRTKPAHVVRPKPPVVHRSPPATGGNGGGSGGGNGHGK
jgi:RNA polymerase sigma factor (sigma-70 family)